MNENDSELIRGILEAKGFRFTDNENQADIVLINTCTVRDNADRKALNFAHRVRNNRNDKPPLIGLLGCMATVQKEKLIDSKKLGIDFMAGPDSYKRLPELIEKSLRDEGRETRDERRGTRDVALSKTETYSDIVPARMPGVNAWISIMRGCDNFCTFCVVPYARGRERSRSAESILSEAKDAVQNGYPQITLLGQNVNSYKFGSDDFTSLIKKISDINGLKRIRFMSPHPKDFPERLLEIIASEANICKHIHLPLQSGNTRILKLMNRGYTQKDYLGLVKLIRKHCPQTSLTTDVIVGFPTENPSEYADTRKVMEDVEFDSAFIFKYSPRPRTLAARKYKDDVSADEKTKRIVELNALQKTISLKKNQTRIGKNEEILIEATSTEKSEKDFQGRTDDNKIVIIPSGPYKTGQLIRVQITEATAHVLKARVTGQ
ncbi:MAG: tRNA (N6-isopentenyl adenosine(37)-C2)-methylthiotransferase MiaB [Candidatus Omnitrophota bacterium]